MPTKRLRVRLLGVVAVGAALCGCSPGSGVRAQGPTSSNPTAASPSQGQGTSTPPTSTPTASASSGDVTQVILAQYRAFFASLVTLSKTEPNARFEAIKRLAADPELTQIMGAMAAATQAGEVYYGDHVLRPKIGSLQPDSATILDCQDTSAHGREVAATGKKLTVGRKNDYAQVTMKLGDDGIWRVATVGYAAAGSCNAEP